MKKRSRLFGDTTTRRDFLKVAGILAASATVGVGLLWARSDRDTAAGSALPSRLRIPDVLGVQIHPNSYHDEDLDLIKDLGVHWVRTDLPWGWVEKRRGVYDFSAHDTLVEKLKSREMGVIFMTGYGNEVYPGGQPPTSPEAREAFANYAVAAARHYFESYPGRVVHEIWNEPNGSFWDAPTAAQKAREYGLLLFQTARRLREDPIAKNATIAAPAMVAVEDFFLKDIFAQRYGTGTTSLSYLDAVSFHPYRTKIPETVRTAPPNTRGSYGGIVDVINDPTYNPTARDVKLIVTEWGYSTHNNPGGYVRGGGPLVASQEEQARWLVRSWLMNLLWGIPVSIWYEWKDSGRDPSDRESNFGLVRADGLRTPKLSLRSGQALIEELGGFEFDRRLPDVGDPGSEFVLRFVRRGNDGADDTHKLAAWTTSGAKTVNIPYHGRSSAAYKDQYGADGGTLIPNGGFLQVPLTQDVKYVSLEPA